MAEVKKQQGHIALYMLIGTGFSSTPSWNLVVSAAGYDTLSKKQAIENLLELLKNTLTKDTLRSLARITILKTNDSFVAALNQMFSVTEDSSMILQNFSVLDMTIDYAVILESAKIPQPCAMKAA